MVALLALVALCLTGAWAAGSSDARTTGPVKVGVVVQNLGTQSYNDDLVAGMRVAEKELGIQSIIIETASIADVANSIRTMIGQGASLVIVPSADMKDAMLETASENPGIKYIFAESLAGNNPSIMSMAYREHEAAFLAGALGALLTKSGKIGAVLAIPSDVQNRYLAGYSAGARAINPAVEVQSAFTNSYADVGKGKEVAKVMYTRGADFVGTYAGACNLGVFQAAAEAGEGRYSFGAATGQFDRMYDKIVASVVKPIDQAIVILIKDFLEGRFDTSKPFSLGLKEAGVGLRFTPNTELLKIIPAQAMATIEDLTAKVNAGTIKVPANETELASFTYRYSR
jgi:basic membrane protein A